MISKEQSKIIIREKIRKGNFDINYCFNYNDVSLGGCSTHYSNISFILNIFYEYQKELMEIEFENSKMFLRFLNIYMNL